MKNYLLVILGVLIFFFYSCEKDSKSDENAILSFSIEKQIDSTKVDNVDKKVTITVSSSINLSKICPIIKISDKATIKPASGDTIDFTTLPVVYSVTSESGKVQVWNVYVNKAQKSVVANLNELSITAITIDKTGTIWIGTETGLYSSVNGGYVLNDDLVTGKILSLSFDETLNILWVGSTNGLTKVTINGTQITPEIVPSSNLSNSNVNASYYGVASQVWFGTDKGLTLLKSNKYKKEKFLTNDLGDILSLDIEGVQINSISSWDGDYYFAVSGYGMYRAYGYDASIDAFTGASFMGSPYNGQAISDTMYVAYTDSKGRMWIGGTSGIEAITGHDIKDQINILYFYDELPNPIIHAIAEAKDGKIWVGTENGLAVFNNSDSTWTNNSNILSNKYVTAIAFDKDGSAWVGTKTGLVNIK
jgi:ligand-binding sensor domain-containing protein